ncbi:septum formation family protein [Amycolatopsis sp., V23-08]|uniref:Septum formation family protein n=1 Tax=Amycolatopsis heterodermiae TaxID=3110235 RepID=A0ABU5RGQ2_9PSEU|nr:septum formation family protein [Amycolatopsis sp., V23-08]MEA5365467.1 septum formation family protein [Amycolatopsis sp., V23-08]
MFDDTRSTLSNHSQTTVRGPVESAGTDGFAITAFVMGLLGLVPFAFGFGIRAVVRTSRTGRSGSGLAIAGMVLAVLWLGVGLVAITPQRAAAPDYVGGMAVGDCLDAGADGGNVIRMACDVPHDEQIAARVDVANGEEAYPGLTTLRELAQPLCRIAGAAYFTGGTPPPGLEFRAHVPTESSWRTGDRAATCTFGKASGKLTEHVGP